MATTKEPEIISFNEFLNKGRDYLKSLKHSPVPPELVPSGIKCTDSYARVRYNNVAAPFIMGGQRGFMLYEYDEGSRKLLERVKNNREVKIMMWNFRSSDSVNAKLTNMCGPWYGVVVRVTKNDGKSREPRSRRGALHITIDDYKHFGQTTMFVAFTDYNYRRYVDVVYKNNRYVRMITEASCSHIGGLVFEGPECARVRLPESEEKLSDPVSCIFNCLPCTGAFDLCILPDSFKMPQ